MVEKCPKLLIVIPCYNEEEVLDITIKKMQSLLKEMIKQMLVSPQSKVCFVNYGSRDNTWNKIKSNIKTNSLIGGINLSRNFGHQSAVLAGLLEEKADIYISIDADLQDDPQVIFEMVQKYKEGNDIVYGVRAKRNIDSLFKKYTALGFYKLMAFLGVNIVYNHADFRLMSNRAVQTLKKFPERNVFLRAMVPLLGFKSCTVSYDRKQRLAGESKYPLKKMVSFAWNGITSFSEVPLHLVTFLGFATCMISFFLFLYSLYSWMSGNALIGWTSLITALTFFSGVILLSIGIIGEYIGKIFIEVKNRPLYIVDEKVNLDEQSNNK